MNEPTLDRLFNLLPALYRQRDIRQGDSLRSLMRVMESELQLLEADIQGLYDNWFIETCDEWVVPYLGDLLGVHGLSEKQSEVLSQRARVANTISTSRRKGTVAALERLIQDSTGWHVKVVESFERLTTTQHLRRIRISQGATFNVRQTQAGVDTPFDLVAHTPDLSGPADSPTKYNVPNVGVYLWRLQSYPVRHSPARAVAQPPDGRYTFDPLGHDMPLFNRPEVGGDFSSATGAVNLPLPISPESFEQDLAIYRNRHERVAPEHLPPNSDTYGPQRSLDIVRVNKNEDETERYDPVTPTEVVVMDLANWDRPPNSKVAVDVRLGRLSFPESETPPGRVQVNYTYGFSADIGGGPYDRHLTLSEPGPNTWQVSVSKQGPITTLQQALKAWPRGAQPQAIIQILDNAVYGGGLAIELGTGNQLVIEAADGLRPSLRLIGNLKVTTPPDETAALVLNGLLLEGGIEIKGNPRLTITHCTVVPGRMVEEKGGPAYPDRDALVLRDNIGKAEVAIASSLVGPLRLSAGCRSLSIQDSLVDAPQVQGQSRPALAADDVGQAGPATSIERSTIFGPVYVTELTLASEVIFTAPVYVKERVGCLRYSYVPLESNAAPRFRCQPDLALTQLAKQAEESRMSLSPTQRKLAETLVQARVRPRFGSMRYGDPAYAQLSPNCAPEIRAGADDDSEMGVFHNLYQSQRETNLRLVLDEYLRFGLEAGIFYVT